MNRFEPRMDTHQPENDQRGRGSPGPGPSCPLVSRRGSKKHGAQRAATTLIALCFVMIMGYTLVSFLALCSRAMNMSNRTFHTNLSGQLAEMGIDEALRAFNKNDWSGWTSGTAPNTTTVTWDTATYASNKRAVATITFPANKFGQGVTASVKIRIDNYDAAQLNATWSSSANYLPDNLVGYSDGNWYRCIADNSNKIPATNTSATAYWVQENCLVSAALTWTSGTSYLSGNMVLRSGNWYRCKAAHTSSSSTEPSVGGSWGTYWVATPYVSSDADLHYTNNSIVRYYVTTYGNDYWFRYNSGWDQITSGGWTLTWHWAQSTNYAVGAIISHNNIWYRCKTAHNSGTGGFSTTNWDSASTLATTAAAAWNWSSTENYNLNDVVYRSSAWYRCIKANINQAPPNATYWSTSPRLSQAWEAGRQYNQYDVVRYNGVWYLSLQNSNVAQNPATATSYWIGANTGTASYQWEAATAYSVGDYKCYGGVWYKCLVATTANANQTPNNTTYWTAAWAQGSGATTGAPVIYAEGTIAIAGNPPVRTQLRATISPASLFPNAVGATSTIFATSGGTVDSYDSVTDPSASSPGYSAVVAAGNTASTAVLVSGAVTVNGYVAAPSSSSSPYAPLFSYGTSTVVKGTSTTPAPKVDVSRLSRSPFIPQFDPLPSGGLTAAFAANNFPKGTALTAATTVNIGTPGATTPSRYYYNADLIMGGGSSVIQTLNINGPVILYINGDLHMTGSPNGIININSTGSAEIHVAGALEIDSGSDGIRSYTLDPKTCILICDTATSASQSYNEGANPFYGVIYMPNTTATYGMFFNNGDTNSTTVYGAVSAKKVAYQNNMNVHYDTSLRYATFGGVDQPYTVDQWRELAGTELATMP
ncbi:MAG TPA: hypothetical protein VG734_22175 [Lacunisphaera sp.]|nr:hypothetical protein [Lacunisphaera sp.]